MRGFRLRGADLERESPQGNEAGERRQNGEDAFPVKGIRVRDEDRLDVRGEPGKSGEGGRNGREDVAPCRDPDVVAEARKAGGLLDRAKELVGPQSAEVEFPFERAEYVGCEGFRGDACRFGEPSERAAVVEADEDVSEVDEEGAQSPVLQGRASWPVRR